MTPLLLLDTFSSRISNIPCLVRISGYVQVDPWAGNPLLCPSDWDWTGYELLELEIQDRNGRPAPWLERKLEEKDWRRLEKEAKEFLKEQRENEQCA